jgi:hypothetical protein
MVSFFKCLLIVTASALFCAGGAGAKTCSNFDEGFVKIPSVRIGDGYIKVRLQPVGDVYRYVPYEVEADSVSEIKPAHATVDIEGADTVLNIPCFNLGLNRTYWVKLRLIPGTVDFELVSFGENTDSLVINEIVAKAVNNGNDWIELYAAGGFPVDLGQYTIVDDNGEHAPVALPSVQLNPGEFFVIQAVDEADIGSVGSFAIPYKLSKGDAVVLFKGGNVADAFDWKDGDAPEGKSYGRVPDGSGVPGTLTPTEGTNNAN